MKDSGTEVLVDPDLPSVIESVKPKSPEKVKEKQKSKKLNPSKSSYDKDLKDLNAKWPESFSLLEALLVARTRQFLSQ